MCVCMYTTCVLDASEGQKRASDLLELEVHVVLSHHVGAGNQTQVSAEQQVALSHEDPSGPFVHFLLKQDLSKLLIL